MRRKKTRVTFRFYVLMLVALCVVVYGGSIAFERLIKRTAVIESGNLGNQYAADVVIVRNERLTDAETITNIRYFADEGALVFRGNKIASVYSTGYSQTDLNKLLNMRAQVKSYLKTLLASSYSDLQLDRMNTQIDGLVTEFRQFVSGKTDGNLLNLEQQLTTSMESRQTYLRNRFLTDTGLRSLYNSEQQLAKKIDSWTVTYLATTDAIISFYTDGYENMLGEAVFDEIPAATVRAILANAAPEQSITQRGRTAVFREVQPRDWKMLLISHERNWNPVVGQSYKVQLEGFDDHVVDGTVTSFARSGSELIVRMRVSGDVKPVLNTRSAKAQVGEMYVSGLKVPLAALRQQGGQVGVVLTDNGGIFVPVEVVIQDNTSAVVRSLSAGALFEGQKVRLF